MSERVEYVVGDRMAHRSQDFEAEIVQVDERWCWLRANGLRRGQSRWDRDHLEQYWRKLPRVVQERLF